MVTLSQIARCNCSLNCRQLEMRKKKFDLQRSQLNAIELNKNGGTIVQNNIRFDPQPSMIPVLHEQREKKQQN